MWHMILALLGSAVKPAVELYRFFKSAAVAAAKDRLRQTAREQALASGSAATSQQCTLPIRSWIDRLAARELEREGTAVITGDQCAISVCTIPPAVMQAMTLRGLLSAPGRTGMGW
jgi:hypothetical protein